MPSHIFTRLGMWNESIESNIASARTAQAGLAGTRPGATAFDALHAMDYLEYAYLQTGQDAKAQAVADDAAKEDGSLSDDLRRTASYLTMRVDEEFKLPAEVDLVALARKFCASLLADKG